MLEARSTDPSLTILNDGFSAPAAIGESTRPPRVTME
jgi:hypothetical protein